MGKEIEQLEKREDWPKNASRDYVVDELFIGFAVFGVMLGVGVPWFVGVLNILWWLVAKLTY